MNRVLASFVVLAVLGSAGLAVRTAARRLEIDNSIPVWLPEGDPALGRYEAFGRVFGVDDFVLVAATRIDLDDAAVRADFEALGRALEGVDGVRRVRGPFGPAGEPGLAAAGGGAAAWLVTPDPERRAGFHERIEAVVAASPLASHLRIAGPEAINHHLDAGSQASFGRLFPVAVLLIAAVVWVAVRDARAAIAVLAVPAIGIAWTMGALALAGRPLNMVVSSLPALLVVLGTAYSMHLVSAYQDAGRWRTAIGETFRPCLLTAATTAAGLAALGLAPIPPVRDLGVFAAFGVVASFGLVFTFVPAVLVLVGTGPAPGRRAGAPAWLPPAASIGRRSRAILGLAAAVAIASGIGIGRLAVESHILSFFPTGHPLVAATRDVEADLMGLTPIEIWFRGPIDRFASPEMIAAARALSTSLEAEDAVTSVFGPLAGSDRFAAMPAERAAPLVRLALTAPPAAAAAPDRLRVEDGVADVRWTVASRTLSIEESHALVGRVTAEVERRLPEGVEAVVTGAIPILLRIQVLLLETQIETFAVSLAVVTALLVVAFRSLRLAALSLVPNLLPIATTLGAMGFAGIPLDVATVTVASIAFGLVVDDTIHVLDRFAAGAGSGRPVADRLDAVYRATGRPIVFTSVATAVGFAAFLVAPFRPTLYFGLLVGGTAISALACDLFVLPALLLVRTRC